MRLLTLILLLAASSAFGQTVKTLGYNTTNGVVQYSGTNVLTFTNDVEFASAATVNFFTVAEDAFFRYAEFNTGTNQIQIDGLGVSFYGSGAATTRANLGFSTNLNSFWGATNATTARAALAITLPALTNTSNVTTMRALAGTTNTNQPFTGIFDFLNGDSNSVSVAISNGIIVSIQ